MMVNQEGEEKREIKIQPPQQSGEKSQFLNKLKAFKLPKLTVPQFQLKAVDWRPKALWSTLITFVRTFASTLKAGRIKKKLLALGGLLLVIAVGIWLVNVLILKPRAAKVAEEAKAAEKPSKDIVPVKVFTVGRFNYEDSLKALGTIKGAMEFKLSFEIPGLVNAINYREGERYEEGALLVSLKQDDILLSLKKAQAEFSKAQTEQSIAEEKFKEHEKLFEIGAIPKTTLDKVKLEVDGARYAAEAASLEVKSSESALEKSNLYAPSDGMIGQLNIEEGEAVTPNTLIGSHVMIEYVYAEFGVVERDVKKLALGQKARVFVDSYPDKTFDGVVENISPMVSGPSRTATIRVRVENPEGLLLPGMFARIKILIYSKKNTVVVPTDSVQGKKEDTFVFVVDAEENLAHKRAIKIGYRREDYSQVDTGLKDNELVVIQGFERLEDGKEVKIVEKQGVQL